MMTKNELVHALRARRISDSPDVLLLVRIIPPPWLAVDAPRPRRQVFGDVMRRWILMVNAGLILEMQIENHNKPKVVLSNTYVCLGQTARLMPSIFY
jgi:hypothetical protein